MNKNIVVVSNGNNYKWEVEGNNVTPCIEDIKSNKRTKQTEYVKTMFRQRYDCVATVIEE